MPINWDEFEAVDESPAIDWSEFEEVPFSPSQIKLSPLEKIRATARPEDIGRASLAFGPDPESVRGITVDLPKDIGTALHTVGGAIGDIAKAYAFEAIGEPELQAQQLGVEKGQLGRLGFSETGLSEPGQKPWEEGAEMLPTVPRVAAKTAAGFIETAPQLALSAVNPTLGAVSFGFTPEGFDPITAGAMLALPGVGKHTGRIAEIAAERLGVPIGAATGMIEKVGGAGGIAGLITADQARHIAELPEHERQKAFEDASGTALAIFAMSMAHRPPSERAIFLNEPKYQTPLPVIAQETARLGTLPKYGESLGTKQNVTGVAIIADEIRGREILLERAKKSGNRDAIENAERKLRESKMRLEAVGELTAKVSPPSSELTAPMEPQIETPKDLTNIRVLGQPVQPGIVRLPSGIPIELPSVTKETARQAAIRQFNERLEQMRFKAPKPTVPEGPEIGMELTTQPTPGMREIKEPGSYDEFVSDLAGKVTPDMTVRQVQELYPGTFKRGEALVNKEAAGELLSDAKKAAHPIDWMEQELNSGKRVPTEEAYNVGLKIRTIEDLERLLQMRERMYNGMREEIAKGNIMKASRIGFQTQMPQEAIEAATFIGEKSHPGLPNQRPLDVRNFPEVREWLRKNINRFGLGEDATEIWNRQLQETAKPAEAQTAKAPKLEVPAETVAPAVAPKVPTPTPAAEPSFLNVPRSKWTVGYLEGLGPVGRAPLIRQAIAALKDAGGKTKLAENATPQTLLKAVNEIMDLRAKQQAAKPAVAPVAPPPEGTVRVYHGQGGPGGAGQGSEGYSVTDNPVYAAGFGTQQFYVDVPVSEFQRMQKAARAKGTPTDLQLSDEYQKQVKPVEKPIETPVTETSFITKESVKASKGKLTPDETDELGRLLTAEEFEMLDAAQSKRLSELRQKTQAPEVSPAPEVPPPAKPPEVTVPPTVPPEPSATVPKEPWRIRLEQLKVEIDALAKKGGLTSVEAERFRALNKEANTIRFQNVKPLDISKIPSPEERKSTLPAEIVSIARNDLISDKSIYDPITDAAIGVSHNAETAIDNIMTGKNPGVSPFKLYSAFDQTRKAMRDHYGNTIKLFRAVGKQKAKPTTNWATTKEYAEQFGDNIVSKDVPIDDVVAVNVGLNGKYHEIIVGKKPAPVETKWKGLTIDEIRKKLPVGFDESTARIEGDRVIAKQKPEYGGREMYVDIKKGEASPVTPEPVTTEVTEKSATQPAPVRKTESYKIMKGQRDLWNSALEKMEARRLEIENRIDAAYKAGQNDKERSLRVDRQQLDRNIEKLKTAIGTIGGEMGLARMREEAAAAKGKPVPAGTQNITNKILKTQKKDLMEQVDKAIKEAPEEGTEKITISVEGDGEFTLFNTKDSLKKFKGIADKQFPETVGGISEPGLPSGKGRAIPAAKDPKPEDIGKIAGEFVSDDKSRFVLQNSYSDGTQIIATDGRQLIRIVTDNAPGRPDAPVRLDDKGRVNPKAEGRFPNWTVIRDPKAELILGGMDTAELAHIAHQAKAFRDTTAEKDRRAQHGVEIYVNKDRTLGARMTIVDELYEHNVQEGALLAGTYNPDYISGAMNAARRLGNEKVDVYAHSGNTGPLGFNGKNFEYIVMPMRIEKVAGRADAPKFSPVAGKAVHGKLPEGYGPIENPLDAITDQSKTAGGATFKTTVEGDTIRFDEIKTRSNPVRGEPSTFEEKVAEIELSKLPEADKSQQAMIAEAIEPYTGKTGAKAIARALQTDLSNILERRRKMEREIQERKGEATKVMPPGPGAASPAEFAQREIEAGRTPPEPPKDTNPGVPIDGGDMPTPEIVRAKNDFNILNRFNSGQFAFYFGRLGKAAKAAWERMAIGEFRMREAIKRDIQMLVDEPLKLLPKEFRKQGGKAFFDVINGRQMDAIETEFSGKPGGQVVIDQVRKVKTRLEEIRTTIRDIKRESYNAYLMGLEKEMLEKLYAENIFGDTMGKDKQGLADALTLDQFPDDWGIADGSYLPHLFFGQWKITAQVPGFETPQFITRAKTPAEAKAKIFELTQRNPEYKEANFTVEQDMMIPADMIRLGDGNFWRLMEKMKEQAQGELNPKEAIQGIIGRKASKQKWFGSLQQRKGFENYSKDYKQVMTAYLNGFQRWKELTAMNRAVQPLIEQVKREGRTNAAGRLTDILETLWGKPSQMTLDFDALMRSIPVARDIVKPMALDRWSRMINTVVTNLTLRTLRFGVVNRLQPLQGLYPLIGEKTLIRAKMLQHSAEGRKLLDESGVSFDTGQYASEISGGSKVSKAVERLSGETSNQELAFLGMYLHGIEKGMDRGGAIRYAKLRGQLMTQFSPLIVDVPPIMEGPLGRVTFQFKRFPIKQIELLAQMAADRNYPALARYFAVMTLSGGIALMLRQVYADKERRLKIKRTLNKAVGEKQADYIFYGMPGLIGADLSGSLVLGDEPFGENFYEKLGRTVMGPGPSLAYETGRAVTTPSREAMSASERLSAISRRIPSLRQIVELKDLIDGNVDVTSPDGEIKYRRKVKDVILGMGSFRSANEANIQMAVSAVIELKKEVAGLKNDYWVAMQSRDSGKINAARQAVKDFNESWPEVAITPAELERYFSGRKTNQPKTDVERAVGKKYAPLLPR